MSPLWTSSSGGNMITFIQATTIEDAWRQAIYELFDVDKSRVYTIDTGSFEGHQRLEFYPLVVIEISNPTVHCLFNLEGKNIPSPVSQEYISEYMIKLFVPEKAEDEDYTYGQFIGVQLSKAIDKLNAGAGTNQATITVGDNTSIDLADPPCLKLVDFRLSDGGLDVIVYFRSWDLWAGFPSNLIGIEHIREAVTHSLGLSDDGKIIAISKGLHLYDYCWDLAEVLNNKKLER